MAGNASAPNSRTGYDRPNRDWVCGYAASGNACLSGPDGGGHCQTRFECDPVKINERWRCTRPESAGGVCDAGPLPDGTCCRAVPPCMPVRSRRRMRGKVVRLATLISLLCVSLIFIVKDRGALLLPSPLSPSHATIDTCISCHAVSLESPLGWLKAAFQDVTVAHTNAKCQSCHDAGVNAERPHGLPAANLEKVTADLLASAPASQGAGFRRTPFTTYVTDREGVACATCHKEHRASRRTLTAFSDGQCQTCHARPFLSFADGHPEFDWVNQENPLALFNHRSHFTKHFQEHTKNPQPKNCGQCHSLQPSGKDMTVKPFDSSCASCHLEQITAENLIQGPKGLEVLAIPELDLQSLADHNAAIGWWPQTDTLTLPPVMRALLSRSSRVADSLDRLDGRVLNDLENADSSQIKDVTTLVWSIKYLLADLMDISSQRQHLQNQFPGSDGSTPAGNAHSGLPPRDMVRAATAVWFPDLQDEVRRHRAGDVVQLDYADRQSVLEVSAVPPEPAVAEEPGEARGPILDEQKIRDIEAAMEKWFAERALPGDTKSTIGAAIQGDIPDQVQAASILAEPDQGWYFHDNAVRYRPASHKDGFFMAWLAALAGPPNDAQPPWTQFLHQQLADKGAPGQCLKCHGTQGPLASQWQSSSTAFPLPTRNRDQLIHFAHGPHVGVGEKRTCGSCHTLNKAIPDPQVASATPMQTIRSEMAKPEKAICLDCHQPEKAGADCVSCHRYHGTAVVPKVQFGGLPR